MKFLIIVFIQALTALACILLFEWSTASLMFKIIWSGLFYIVVQLAILQVI